LSLSGDKWQIIQKSSSRWLLIKRRKQLQLKARRKSQLRMPNKKSNHLSKEKKELKFQALVNPPDPNNLSNQKKREVQLTSKRHTLNLNKTWVNLLKTQSFKIEKISSLSVLLLKS
jgi:hypothetical protein